jgi:hypothetical protein
MSDIAALPGTPSAQAPGAQTAAAPAAAARPQAASARAAALMWQWRRADDGAARARQAAAARKKGAWGGAIGLAVATALWFWKPGMATVVAAVAVLLALLALASPLGAYKQIMRVFDLFAHGVGVVMTWVLMSLAWLLVFLPAGLLLRAAGKLRITKGPAAQLASYWSPAQDVAPGIEPYKKPF